MLGAYEIHSKDYLDRAGILLKQEGPERLFYAALELRCGIEARMQEYLEAYQNFSRTRRAEWRIAKLGHEIEHAFRNGDRIVELKLLRGKGIDEPLTLYYTPVTRKLQKSAQRLGDLLHASGVRREISDPWWTATEQLLADTVDDLRIATSGTLMGPPLQHKRTGAVRLLIQARRGEAVPPLELFEDGNELVVRIAHHQTLPR